ncbi:hypothetical protein P7C73_g3666, partial [Tremellales sp. Uapishka_1]
MSPIPPPVAFMPASEDWSESFELPSTAQPFAVPSSPSSSSSTSHHSRHSLSGIRSHASSPLRNSYSIHQPNLLLKPHPRDPQEDDDDFDLDVPDSFPALRSPKASSSFRPRSSTASSSTSLRNIPKTVMGSGPAGVGTITKLGGNRGPSLPTGTVKARAMALERAWEADVDFDVADAGVHGTGRSSSNRLTLSPPRKNFMPDADALDDLGFDLDEEDKEATLKAGATIKAMLPPPRSKPYLIPPPTQDADFLENDFALPLSLNNLTLATLPQSPRQTKSLRPRTSLASTANTESWDSPATSGSGKKSVNGAWSWGDDDSPLGRKGGKKPSETSGTSVSDGPSVRKVEKEKMLDEEDDMESGLVLPSPTFFSSARSKELNSLLDLKRKPQYAPPLPPSRPESVLRDLDESFEDGLVLENPRAELSHHRLSKNKRARTIPVPFSLGSKRQQPSKTVTRERERVWEKEKEHGWTKPTMSSTGSFRMGTIGLSGLRSHSASATATLKDLTGVTRPESPMATRENLRSRSGQPLTSMAPPPIPKSTPSIPPPASATPSTSSRLRHQKSHYHMQPPQSPSLTRKQSLASLQDALQANQSTLENDFSQMETPPVSSRLPTASQSHSRLTMPTTSSRAKARPAITSVFPRNPADITASSSNSSMSTSASFGQISTPKTVTRGGAAPRLMDLPRRSKTWGDGTELEGIEDLQVEAEKSVIGLGKPARRGHDSSLGRASQIPETIERRKKSGSQTKRQRARKPALLIKHLGGVDKKKVVGDMTWNPQTLRWEGNEACLRDFDTQSTSSVRPALIAHYTGSSVGGASSPAGAAAPMATIRIVGDMKFDPEKMCWVSTLDPEDDEPDPFEGMADDEDDEGGRGGTITRSLGRKLVSIGGGSGFSGSVTNSSAWSSRLASESSASVSSWQGSNEVEAEEGLYLECKEAEERHRKEMRGWLLRAPMGSLEIRERERREEKRLWEIRNLALKS